MVITPRGHSQNLVAKQVHIKGELAIASCPPIRYPSGKTAITPGARHFRKEGIVLL